MKIIKLSVGLIILTVLTACDSEMISSSRLLVKEIQDATCYRDEFTYQGGQLATFQRFFGDREETRIEYHYSDDKLTRIENVRDHGLENYIELTYNENGQRQQEKVTTIYNGDTTRIRTGTFSYQNGDLKSALYTYNNPEYATEESEFHWDKGNLTRIDFYYYFNNTRHLAISRLYSYDNKLNYSNEDLAFVYTGGIGDETRISRNNLVSTQDVSDSYTYQGGQYSFTYNDSGYPDAYVYKSGGQEFAPTQIRYY